MPHLTKGNFADKVQGIFEAYYLQPYKGKVKENLRDGFIERRLYGAMHVSRTILWTLSVHKFLKDILPEYVDDAFNIITQRLNLNQDSLMFIILATMACHDVSRKGNQDWDINRTNNSEEIFAAVLTGLGLDEKNLIFFTDALKAKDHPDYYLKSLSKQHIPPTEQESFDYIRKLMSLGHRFDTLRFNKRFKISEVFDVLECIPGFNTEAHYDQIVIRLKAVLQCIYDQQDMYQKSSLLDLKWKKITSYPARFNLKVKVQYEHADNVFAAVLADVLKFPVFGITAEDFKIPEYRKFEGDLAFDPFLHGTNSSILSILPKSDFHLMSPLEMIDEYQASPACGELTGGGYRNIGLKNIKNDIRGKTSFGQLSFEGFNVYSLEHIIRSYGGSRVRLLDANVKYLKDVIKNGPIIEFSNFDLLLIYFASARQLTNSLDEVISQQELAELREEMHLTLQLYHLLLLLGRYIFPDYALIQQSSNKKDIYNAIFKYLTSENIKTKIKELRLDLQAILANPTLEHLNKVLKLLELPREWSVVNGVNEPEKQTENPPDRQFFTLIPPAEEKFSFAGARYNFFNISICLGGIASILGEFAKNKLDTRYFRETHKIAQKYLIAFNDRIRVFEKIIRADQSKFKLPDFLTSFSNNAFPLILISEKEEKIHLFSIQSHEYRSETKLKLGVDVTMIATDTHAHRLEILNYLEFHQLKNVQVVLFDDLRASKINHQKPVTSYHHQDGIPTLKWMAAKKASSCNTSFFKSQEVAQSKAGFNSEGLYSKKNLGEVNALLEDAAHYHELRLLKS